jgi:hypothetical protein
VLLELVQPAEQAIADDGRDPDEQGVQTTAAMRK